MPLVERVLARLAPLASMPIIRTGTEVAGAVMAPSAASGPAAMRVAAESRHHQPDHDEQDEQRDDEAEQVPGPEGAGGMLFEPEPAAYPAPYAPAVISPMNPMSNTAATNLKPPPCRISISKCPLPASSRIGGSAYRPQRQIGAGM